MESSPIYQRILLKMSGEALLGNSHSGIDAEVVLRLAKEIAALVAVKVQVAIVIGGGNLFRGANLESIGIDRITGDQMGMLATVMNGLALRDALERTEIYSQQLKLQRGASGRAEGVYNQYRTDGERARNKEVVLNAKSIVTRLFSAFAVSGIADAFDRLKAIHSLEQNEVVIFTGGTGNPLFTTDSAASLRDIEIEADAILKATKVDGVYSDDPVKVPSAKRYTRLTFAEVLMQDLKVMDLSAITLCRDHQMPIHVFDINKSGALMNVVMGKEEGTIITHQ